MSRRGNRQDGLGKPLESPITHGHGRNVQKWKPKLSRLDNHWLDCLVGCAVAASICGVKLPGMDAKPTRCRIALAWRHALSYT